MEQVTNIYIDTEGLTHKQVQLVDKVFTELSRDKYELGMAQVDCTPIWSLDRDGDRMFYSTIEKLEGSSYSSNCESISYGTILEYARELCIEYKTERVSKNTEMVDKPNHYQLLPEYQVRDINKAILDKVQESSFDMSLDEAGWFQQAMQYFMRFYAKNGVEDLEKGVYAMNIVIGSLKGRKDD